MKIRKTHIIVGKLISDREICGAIFSSLASSVFSSAAAKRLRHTLYVEVSRFSQPLEGGFGEQLLRNVYPPLVGVDCSAKQLTTPQ